MVSPEDDCIVWLRASELTMPAETDWSRPNGLPTDMTQSPTTSLSELPTSIGVTSSSPMFALMTAMSLEASDPTTFAS